MGRKRTRAGKFIYLCIASLIFLALIGCAALESTHVNIKGTIEAYQSLHRGKELLAQGAYENASNENLKVLSLGLHRSPEDKAFYNLGLIHAHPQNLNVDYRKSLFFFKKLREDFPNSHWSERARIWEGILLENEKLDQKIEALMELLNQADRKSKQLNIKIEERKEIRDFSLLAKKLLAQGNFDGALKENQKILSLSGSNPPGDEALFNIGLIYVHPGNPKKDYGNALLSFNKLAKDFPQSPWVDQSKIWVGVVQESLRLNQTIDKLNTMIEESKQVDIQIEERKRERGK